jgi:hypothetical protein
MSTAHENPALEPVRHADGTLHQFMPKVGGKPFFCHCKCNVFHKPDRTRPHIYECNACGEWYAAED